jgi:hypothetical protein
MLQFAEVVAEEITDLSHRNRIYARMMATLGSVMRDLRAVEHMGSGSIPP